MSLTIELTNTTKSSIVQDATVQQRAGRGLASVKNERTLHWARHETLLDWVRLGWIVAKPNREMHHDVYAVTVEWLCQCEPVRPANR